MLPANIRFAFYPSREEVQQENKFAALPLKVPLMSTMEEAYKSISKVTKQIKANFGYIYAAYAFTLYGTLFGARQIPRLFLHKASMKFTCSFSNVAGPLKYFTMADNDGNHGYQKWCYPYVMVAGRVGMCISCISYGDSFTIALSCDEAICPDPQTLVDLMIRNIQDEIKRIESDVPEEKETKKEK